MPASLCCQRLWLLDPFGDSALARLLAQHALVLVVDKPGIYAKSSQAA